jgi:hypothetical protein
MKENKCTEKEDRSASLILYLYIMTLIGLFRKKSPRSGRSHRHCGMYLLVKHVSVLNFSTEYVVIYTSAIFLYVAWI